MFFSVPSPFRFVQIEQLFVLILRFVWLYLGHKHTQQAAALATESACDWHEGSYVKSRVQKQNSHSPHCCSRHITPKRSAKTSTCFTITPLESIIVPWHWCDVMATTYVPEETQGHTLKQMSIRHWPVQARKIRWCCESFHMSNSSIRHRGWLHAFQKKHVLDVHASSQACPQLCMLSKLSKQTYVLVELSSFFSCWSCGEHNKRFNWLNTLTVLHTSDLDAVVQKSKVTHTGTSPPVKTQGIQR